MLVVTRKANQSIRITGPCTVTVLEFAAGKVRIGLEGPVETRFVRSELDKRDSRKGTRHVIPAGDPRQGGPPEPPGW